MLEYVNGLNSAKGGGPGLQRSQHEDPEKTMLITLTLEQGKQYRAPSPTPTHRTALTSPGMEVRCM